MRMKSNRSLGRLGRATKRAMMFSLVAGSAVSLSAATTNAPSLLPPKPKWLKEASVTVKESYDDNVFCSELARGGNPPGNSARAVEEKNSWVTTISPKVTVDFAPLISSDPEDLVRSLTLGYLPEFARYHDAQSENYMAERFASGLKLKCGDVSLTADQLFTYINGSALAPTYPGAGFYNAYVNSAVRERREQVKNNANVALQYDMDCWFVRGVGMLQNINMLTEQYSNVSTGYVNYVDRGDRNFGGDIGYKVTTNFAVTAGYRLGEQHQEKLPVALDANQRSTSSEYHRLLLGMEGKPVKWLTTKVQAGPEFRNYDDCAVATVKDDDPVTFYADASLDAKLSAKDNVGLKYKQGRSVSSTGVNATEEYALDLTYAHKLTDQLTVLLGGRVLKADYRANVGNTRNDYDYIVNAGVRYAFTKNLSAELGHMLEMGRNADDSNAANDDRRTFDRNVTSLSVTLAY